MDRGNKNTNSETIIFVRANLFSIRKFDHNLLDNPFERITIIAFCFSEFEE